ncbi:hypothetical protein M4I32_12890 [Microbacterium sp. LRZ72]|uniref:hypothetical protein n=1 Tax=Microbacterium sp. LRZ72 TaxID=2942481 RepID=UPI0029AA1FF8|nr:hypothetical protein [Microbacterium sp. LRZ72]MDX2377698.1 hypothetical protein [Microbacterium sp. LRZ72]
MNTRPEPFDPVALIAADAARVADKNSRSGSSAPLGATVINWRTLTGSAAAMAWADLRDWVEWFTSRYNVPVSTVPDCWWQHGALVEELTALRTAHAAAFDPTDTGYGPISWHERLTVALPRLTRAYSGGCNTTHRSNKPRSWSNVTDEQEWEQWTSQAHAH